MAYDGKLLARARAELARQKEENLTETRLRRQAAYRRVPELEEIELRLRSQTAQLLKLSLSRREEDRRELDEVIRAGKADRERRQALLKKYGYPEHFLDEVCSCPKCRDTGFVDGRVCECLEAIYKKELTKELSELMLQGDESFEHFDLSLYDDVPGPNGVNPRETMTVTLGVALRFAEKFPDVSRSLLFAGETGLGKTYLSACIARQVAERGFSVCYASCAEAIRSFDREVFSRDEEESAEAAARVRRMLDCDLMILDDLGTEYTGSMSMNALYRLLNHRLTHRKRMILSTNLNPEELARRYTPAIVSRIEGEFLRLTFAGSDIRRKKK